ncbi:hypothetical protein NCC49_002419 [Naganishia albida]|nr:hypothetical protein NCC49_002419 [Naganishia albida]
MLAAFNPVSEEVKMLSVNAKQRNAEERLVLSQLREQYDNMGLTKVKLQGDLEEEKSARAAKEEELRGSSETIKRLTEENSRLLNENIKIQAASRAELDNLFAEMEERLEVEREILHLRIDQLETENAELQQENSQLEASLKQATVAIEKLEVSLQGQKDANQRLEERFTNDLDASANVCSGLRKKNSQIERELAALNVQKEESDQKCEKLAAEVNVRINELSAMQEDYEKRLQEHQQLSASGEKELQGQLQSLEEQVTSLKDALLESKATIQQIVQERDAEVDKTRELDNQLENLRKDYIQNLAERDSSLKTSQDVMKQLAEQAADAVKNAKENSELQTLLALSNDSKLKAESELSRLERLRSDLGAEHHALESKYRALQQTLEEMQKKMEDGKAAHQEDVTKERVRYEELKAIQDSLKERYQTGDLTPLEQGERDLIAVNISPQAKEQPIDLLRVHVGKIQANHADVIKKLQSELAKAQTEVSTMRKTATRAANEKSQLLGGRSLIGSDFDEPSSSPHEALRSVVARKEFELMLSSRDAGVALGESPSSPLTAINISSEKRAPQQESQSLSSFLAGGASVNKRVSFQELANNNTDEMDNDMPDTLSKIAEDDDEREEDIEESESLIEPVKRKSVSSTSSIRGYTQAAQSTNVSNAISQATAAVTTSKNAQGKGSASLGMTRTTRSTSQIMTYSGVSRKRGTSVLAGTDMESFTSTQEDAIYGKRGGLKKQRK